MHSLYFVIIKQEAKNSQEARRIAENVLLEENFCSSGFWGCGKGDWFNIGGSWSGILQLTKLGIDAQKFEELSGEEQQRCWEKKGGTGLCPCSKRGILAVEYEDDAILVDKPFYEKLLKNFPDVEVFDAVNYREDMLADFDPKDIIGRWIIAIDYHS